MLKIRIGVNEKDYATMEGVERVKRKVLVDGRYDSQPMLGGSGELQGECMEPCNSKGLIQIHVPVAGECRGHVTHCYYLEPPI